MGLVFPAIAFLAVMLRGVKNTQDGLRLIVLSLYGIAIILLQIFIAIHNG